MGMNSMTDKNSIQARDEIISLHTGILQSARRSVQDAIKIGGIIAEQKPQLEMKNEFNSWLKSLPFAENTARNYIQLFNYRHKTSNIEDLSTAYKKVSEIEYQEKKTAEERKRSMIAEFRKTGIKPAGWDRSLDYIIQKDKEQLERQKQIREQEEINRNNRVKEREQKQHAENLFSSALEQATNEIFEKHAERKTWQEKIRLSENGKEDSFMSAIVDYLATLYDDNRRIEACYNIIKICKNIAIELQRSK